jgi:hypothetical protein
MEFCDGPEDCAGGAVCRFSYPTIGCGSPPSELRDAALNPVVCRADCDCPPLTPICAGGDFKGVRFFGKYCHATCTTREDCPDFLVVNPPAQCAGSDPSICVY